MFGLSPSGKDFIVNSTTKNSQRVPDVTALPDGRFVVIWVSSDAQGADKSETCIRGRIYNADGTPAAPDFVVNTSTNSIQYDPKVAPLSDGGFVVTWDSQDGQGIDGDGSCIRGRIYTASGKALGDDFVVNSTHASNQFAPAVSTRPDGSFVVTWWSYDGGGLGAGNSVIRARAFEPNGTPLGDDVVVSTTPGGNRVPTIAILPDGRIVVAWQALDGGESASLYDVRARIYNADGFPDGEDFLVNTSTEGHQFGPAISAFPDGRFVVTWRSEATPGWIRGRLYNADGAPAGPEFVVDSKNLFPKAGPGVTVLPDGRFVVIWESNPTPTVGPSFSVRVFTADGTAIGEEFSIYSTFSSSQEVPRIAALPDGRLVATWSSADVTDLDIRARILDTPWTKLGTEAANSIAGTSGSDAIQALGGNDTVLAGSGNDLVYAGAGNDSVDGGSGNDTVVAGIGDDNLKGGSGNDSLLGGEGKDTIDGGDGDDRLLGQAGDDNLKGGSGHDIVDGGEGNESLNGGIGNDTVLGAGGNDTIDGSTGNDLVDGGLGNDLLKGGSGYDIFRFNSGFGQDRVLDFTSLDKVMLDDVEAIDFFWRMEVLDTGGRVEVMVDGFDTIRFDSLSTASARKIALVDANGTAVTLMTGTSAANTMKGSAGADFVQAFAGNDSVLAGAGDDTIDGGAGNDTIEGGSGWDVLLGGEGNDRLLGGSDVDLLFGDAGNDVLNGGSGVDYFIFSAGFGKDTIEGFDADPVGGQDWIDVSLFGITAADFAGRVSIVAAGVDTTITVDADPGQTIRVLNVASSAITQADFLLVS